MKRDGNPGYPPRWALWGLSMLALIPGGYLAATSDFSGLYGQDAYAYFDYATGPLREALRSAQPFPPFFWPPGYPLLVALFSFILGPRPLAGQLVSWIAAGLVPVFTAFLTEELALSKKAGLVALLAGLFVALTGQLWQSAVVVMSDTTALAAGTIGMWALARYGNRSQARWLAGSAIALALAVITRLAYWLVVIPAIIYACIVLLRQPWKQALQHAVLAGALAAIILLPVLWPTITFLSAPEQENIVFAGAAEVYRWNPLTAVDRVHVTADGLLSYRLPNGIYYAVAPARSFYFSPLTAVFILPGLWTVFRRRAWAPGLLLAGWAASVYVFHAGAAWQNFRFTLVYLPPLAILAALGVVWLFSFTRKRFPAQTWLTWCVALWLLAGLCWASVGGWQLTRGFIGGMQANVETVRWVEEQVPPGAQLLAFALALTFQHESDLQTYNIFSLTSNELHSLASGDRPVYLLIDVDSVETQWAGRAPAENFHWLQQGPGLIEVGRRQQYTLFAVNAGFSC